MSFPTTRPAANEATQSSSSAPQNAAATPTGLQLNFNSGRRKALNHRNMLLGFSGKLMTVKIAFGGAIVIAGAAVILRAAIGSVPEIDPTVEIGLARVSSTEEVRNHREACFRPKSHVPKAQLDSRKTSE